MAELTTEICAFPGCERPVVAGPEGAGRPARYCELPGHNAQTAFRERRRGAAAALPERGLRVVPGQLAVAGRTARSLGPCDDRPLTPRKRTDLGRQLSHRVTIPPARQLHCICLLYTSDAADEED